MLTDPLPRQTLATYLQQQGSTKQVPVVQDDILRGILFSLLFEEAMHQNPLFLVEEYRKGTIQVVPELFMFTLVKKVPRIAYERIKTSMRVQQG